MNTFSLFKQIDRKLYEEIGIEVEDYRISYYSEGEEIDFEMEVQPFSTVVMSELSTDWMPENNDLVISQKIKFKNPEILFGVDGVTLEENTLGIGMHIHSRTAMFQQTISKAEIRFDDLKNEYYVSHHFDSSVLRGKVNIETFIYTKEINKIYPKHAEIQGMKVSQGNLSELSLVIDGTGSVFPIGEFSEENGPLWKMEFGNFDATVDMMSFDNLRLLLNNKHRLFNQIKDGKTPISRGLMTEIMSQAMTLIISKVVEENTEELLTNEVLEDGTIISAVKYWITTFEIKTDSLIDISNSIRVKLEQSLNGD
ncbi:hypothetical protein ACEE44_03485 [Streptococcus sp. 32226D021BW]